MTKQEFVDNYVVTFLASYGAEKYDFNAMHGKMPDCPVEDAEFMALEAWEAAEKFKPQENA